MSNINTRKEILLAQLATCQDETQWFAPLSVALEQLTPESANLRDKGLDNSIWEIVKHLIFWNERCLQQFVGESVEEKDFENDSTFFRANSGELTVAEWESAVTRLNSVMSDWRAAILDCDEAALNSLVYPNRPWWMQISNVILHNVYHIGQIVYIRKNQGNWNPVKWD
jgi:hypothetical protein